MPPTSLVCALLVEYSFLRSKHHSKCSGLASFDSTITYELMRFQSSAQIANKDVPKNELPISLLVCVHNFFLYPCLRFSETLRAITAKSLGVMLGTSTLILHCLVLLGYFSFYAETFLLSESRFSSHVLKF
jgi:hypothetical protein